MTTAVFDDTLLLVSVATFVSSDFKMIFFDVPGKQVLFNTAGD